MKIVIRQRERGRREPSSSSKLKSKLQNLYVLCLPALRSLGYVELYRLTFLQRAKSIGLNRCVMHEDVFSVCAAQKSKSLCVVKPLHCSLFHLSVSFIVRDHAEFNSGCQQVVRLQCRTSRKPKSVFDVLLVYPDISKKSNSVKTNSVTFSNLL